MLCRISRPALIAASAHLVLPLKAGLEKPHEIVFAPLPSLFSCAAQMQNSLPYLEIALLVFLLSVFILCFYLGFCFCFARGSPLAW